MIRLRPDGEIHAETIKIGKMPVIIVRPKEPSKKAPGVLWIHGGGLCAALCMLARDKGKVNIAFQMPLYPMLDNLDTESSRDNHGKDFRQPIPLSETGSLFMRRLWNTSGACRRQA